MQMRIEARELYTGIKVKKFSEFCLGNDIII